LPARRAAPLAAGKIYVIWADISGIIFNNANVAQW
jgi:hypothetical protein